MGRDRTRIERLEQLSQTGGPVTDVTGTAPIVVTTPIPGVRNVSISGAGAGTVTSVNVTGSDSSVVVTGSPITSSGTINLAVGIDPLTAKTTPVAADEFILADSAASFANKKITYANLVAAGSGMLQWAVHQVAHGFVVGNVVTEGASAWAKSNNGTSTLTADAIVAIVAGADDFTLQQFGLLTLTTGQWDAVCGTTGGLTQGQYYWVDSTAGKMTATQPSGASNFQQVGIKALSTTQAEVLLPSDALINNGGGLTTQQDGTNVSTTATALNIRGPSVITGTGATATLTVVSPDLASLGSAMT
jgi:hypothetical protein